MKDEGAFAASGRCVITHGAHEVWFGTGGPDGARVFHSRDGGKTWSVVQNSASEWVPPAAFSPWRFLTPATASPLAAITKWTPTTAGTWRSQKTAARRGLQVATASGFRSDIAYLPEARMWISVGTAGSDVSTDGGLTWRKFGPGFNAISFTAGATGWAVGPNGSIAKFKLREYFNALWAVPTLRSQEKILAGREPAPLRHYPQRRKRRSSDHRLSIAAKASTAWP